ncbi:MAG TPA: DinB family protein [Acidobacteriaceae bacterium]|nr:DinB family protein [Acidobacteriaceae bacterium]
MADNVEPWLRGTRTEEDAVLRAVLHALDLAAEDADRWCTGLSDAEINARPHGLAPVAFHLRHIARSLDRLLSYAEGTQLDASQLAALKCELDAGATTHTVMEELHEVLKSAIERVRAFSPEHYNNPRGVGRKMMPTTVGGLLVHCADHTQRHIGQAVTTAKVVMAMRA